jgi:hypothetical protein
MYGGDISSVYKEYARQLDRHSHSDVAAVIREVGADLAPGSPSQFKLGQIKDFATLATLAQTQGLAFSDVKGGAQYLKDEARAAFKELAETVVTRVEESPDNG